MQPLTLDEAKVHVQATLPQGYMCDGLVKVKVKKDFSLETTPVVVGYGNTLITSEVHYVVMYLA